MKVIGMLLLAVGILIAGASGLCSLAVLGSGLGGNPGESILIVLLVGGIPFAIGIGIAFLGRTLIRRADRKQRHGQVDADTFS